MTRFSSLAGHQLERPKSPDYYSAKRVHVGYRVGEEMISRRDLAAQRAYLCLRECRWSDPAPNV